LSGVSVHCFNKVYAVDASYVCVPKRTRIGEEG